MANRPNVPKFGNWESQENVPYTVFFDKARKNRSNGSTKMVNPNDPRENPELFSNQGSPSRAPPPRPKPNHEGHVNNRRGQQEPIKIRDEAGFRQARPVSPARNENYNRAGGEVRNQRYGSGHVENPMETRRQPVHVQPQGRVLGQDGHKGHYPSSSHGIAGGRTKPIPNVRNEQKSAAIPKFGVWDENSAVAADGFTHIFDQVREEKNQRGNVTGTPSTPSRPINHGSASPTSPKSCCFPWSRKRGY